VLQNYEEVRMARQKQDLGKDTRAEIKVDPNVELKDYSGPFRPNLRFTDFSREQLGKMYSLAHHYNYTNVRAYRDYVRNRWGPEAFYEGQEAIWGEMLVDDIHRFITETMNIKGKDLEAFMKHWQVDLNSQPGDFFDVIIEMPSKDRGIVTFNRCPVVDEYEASGRTDELHDICTKTCPPAIKNTANLYNTDIDLKVLALPPRKSKDHICCKFEVCYKSRTAKTSKETEKVDLRIDKKKRDIRGDIKIDPKVKLEDYSGPFKPDLRITDFSREQLARMYLMAHQYDLAIMMAYNMWVGGKFGFDGTGDMNVAIWGTGVIGDVRKLHMRFMNIAGNDLESFMKAWQMDVTSQMPNFDMKFEMPSKDRGIVTFNTCFGVMQMEKLGMSDEILKVCALDPPAIGNSARFYHPDMRVKIHAFPLREGEDEICCKWELYYDPTAPTVTWFDNRE
jgi:hypothetical protein